MKILNFFLSKDGVRAKAVSLEDAVASIVGIFKTLPDKSEDLLLRYGFASAARIGDMVVFDGIKPRADFKTAYQEQYEAIAAKRTDLPSLTDILA